MRNRFLFLIALIAAAGVAFLFAQYVYPVHPLITWLLLLFCWLCYRLQRRAMEMFGPPIPEDSGGPHP